MDNKIKYVVVTPVRNEELYIKFTLDSIVKQSIHPLEWIIVDDGSNDRTGEIIDEYSVSYPFIKTIHRKDRGFRKAGGGVIEAFYEGYNTITQQNLDYIVKLDGDLSFENNYFEKCFQHFIENNKLGIGGGDIYHDIDGKYILEKNPKFHVRGATKIYKRECWDAISPLYCSPGWDTIDEVKANMLGWHTKSFSDLKIVHHRYTGMADGNWKNSVKNGLANYIAGYHPLFMAIKILKRAFNRPFIIGSIGYFYGYAMGYFRKVKKIEDPALIKYIRRQQLNLLLFKETIWK